MAGPTAQSHGLCDSPYQCFSAFAGNHLLLSFEHLREAGILDASDLASVPFPEDSVDYGRVIDFKLRSSATRSASFFLRMPRAPIVPPSTLL